MRIFVDTVRTCEDCKYSIQIDNWTEEDPDTRIID